MGLAYFASLACQRGIALSHSIAMELAEKSAVDHSLGFCFLARKFLRTSWPDGYQVTLDLRGNCFDQTSRLHKELASMERSFRFAA